MIALLLALQMVGTPTTGGSLAGRVTGQLETPVRGARVRIDALEREVLTGPGGHYRLTDLPDGRWLVEVRADGHLDRGVVVRVTGGASVTLDFVLEPRPATPTTSGAIAGVVLEESRLEPVHFALVEVVPLGRRVLTDEDGLFSVGGVPAGAWTLRVSAPGYVPLERALPVEGTAGRLEVRLAPGPLPLAELVVRGERVSARVQASAPEARVVDSALVSLTPTVVERDVLRTVQVLPSVTPASDFNTAPYVRGGTLGQTRVVLDGTPLHNPYHLGGFVSALEASAVDVAVLRPGGLPASAASGLSGLVEVHTRDGGRDSVRVAGGAALLSSALTASGPWGGGSWLLSARRTYIDLASAGLRELGLIDADWPYHFWDVLGKVTIDLGRRDRSLTLSTYLDREGFHDGDRYAATWGSDALSARFRGLLTDVLTLEAGIATSGFNASFTRTEEDETAGFGVRSDLEADVRSWIADVAVEANAGVHLLSLGGRVERTSASQDLQPRGSLVSLLASGTTSGRYGTTAVYVRDRWRVGERLALDLGVRGEKAPRHAWMALPRGRVELDLGERSSLSLAAGKYMQDWWSLRNEEGVLASIVAYDVTVPVPDDLPLARAWDLVLGWQGRFRGWAVRADAFRKRMHDVPTSLPAVDPSDTRVTLSPDSIRLGEQRVDGLELFATGTFRSHPLAISYRLQRERSVFEGEAFVPRRARTHRVVINTRRSWGERTVALSLTWMTGRPYTPPLAALPAWGEPGKGGRFGPRRFVWREVVLGRANSARMPGYLRVDVDARGAWDLTLFGRRGVLEPYLSVLNVLNGNNALFVTPIARGDALVLEVGPQLPLLPTFGVRWRF